MSEDFQRVKDAINLADYIGRYASLKRAGTVMQCCCPLPGHNDKSPSFQVKGDGWICRGKCDAYGDIFDFVERYHGWDKQQALEELARYAGVTLTPLTPEHKAQADKRERLYALMEDAVGLFEQARRASENATMYLTKTRGLSLETINAARIGYGPDQWEWLVNRLRAAGYSHREMIDAGVVSQKDTKDESTIYDRFRNRIVIPTRDSRGRVVAFTGRAMSEGQDPKYMHNATTDIFLKSSIIHRMPEFAPTRGVEGAQTVVIVEGSIDPISAANRGFLNIASLLGKSCSDDQMNLLVKTGADRLVFCLDRDESGIKALRSLTQKHVERLASQGIALYAMFAPYGKDPDDTFREKPDSWVAAVDAARPVVEVLIDLELAPLGAHRNAAKVSAKINELLPILKSDNPLIQDENIHILSSKTGVAFDRLKNWLEPQMHVMEKPAPAPKQESTPLPTTEEWVLHGILCNEADRWLARANACLFIASDSPMPYALAPLNEQDFTDPQLRRFFVASVKAQAAEEMIKGHIDASLERVYERIKGLIAIGKEFNLSFDYDVFIDRVYALRLDRLRKERPTYEAKDPAKARECAIGIACIQMAQEDLLDTI
jgi:DNA primase catalytic core